MSEIRAFSEMTDAEVDAMSKEECQHAIRTIRDFLIAASTNLPSVDDCLPSTSSSTPSSDAAASPEPAQDTLIFVTPAAALPNHK
ncbi:hypothetical protein PRIPAC_70610 [Pristionchus pacificus]|uniref:Uncharacterized protein n=1 Tax=Pristionchus pacificus TaxID=54126 RepID=A0A454XS47_PRIPA|nr:hypothetical protein PRIPAC_70610 [Pristionchus pacificus]|eukprot:PDM74040.1 hypothetical protein PRIPAC_41396 [Pristionchus pacificus]